MKLLTADETAEVMLARLFEDLEVKAGEELLVIVNGMGSTTLMELFIVFRRVLELAPRKIRVNAIAPGHTETDGNVAAGTFEGGTARFWRGRPRSAGSVASPDIAPLAVFLASDESAWIVGEVIRAAGGLVVAT